MVEICFHLFSRERCREPAPCSLGRSGEGVRAVYVSGGGSPRAQAACKRARVQIRKGPGLGLGVLTTGDGELSRTQCHVSGWRD